MFGSNSISNSSPRLSPKISNADSGHHYRFSQQHRRSSADLDEVEMNNVITMVCFATALMENLARINRGKSQI